MIRLLLLTACVAFAQTGPAFDVASVKPNTSSKGGGEGSRRESVQVSPGSVIMRNVSLQTVIAGAYQVPAYQVTGPGWLADERYDVEAKTLVPASEEQMRPMMRTLLADRFALKIHRQPKEMSALVAVVAKGGAKLKPAANPDGPYSLGRAPGAGGGFTVVLTSISIEDAMALLAQPLQMPMVDETGIKGRYDVTIDMTPYLQDIQTQKGQGLDQGAILEILNRAGQEQLGLKLEQRKTTVQMVVVDSAERVPTVN